MRVLVVEDDQRIAHFVAKGLRENTYAVDVAVDGAAALYALKKDMEDRMASPEATVDWDELFGVDET